MYIRSLDGLRALAVTLVMLFHFRLLDSGWIGVQIFFVLSGFLITTILLKEKEQTLSFYLKRFYWRRSLRIFPLYFTYLLLISLVFLFIPMPDNVSGHLPYLYTYTYNFSRLSPDWQHTPLFTHFWSLSVEEQFYLFWPLLVYLLPDKWLKRVIVFILITGPAVRYGLGELLLHNSNLSTEAAGEAIYWFTFSHLDAFALGGAITIFNLPQKIKYPSRIFAASAILVLAIGLFNFYNLPNTIDHLFNLSSFGYPIGSVFNYQHIWSYTLLNICFASLIIVLLTKNKLSETPFTKIFGHPFLVSVGKVSYGIYVFHWAIMAVFFKTLSPFIGKGWIAFIFYFMLVYIISYISFNFYEKQFLKLKDKYYQKIPAKAKATV